jgi:hypothetical protein
MRGAIDLRLRSIEFNRNHKNYRIFPIGFDSAE